MPRLCSIVKMEDQPNEAVVEELAKSLTSSDTPVRLRVVAMLHVAGLTVNAEGVELMLQHKRLLEVILRSLNESIKEISEIAFTSTINLTGNRSAAMRILEDYDITTELMKSACNPKFRFADQASKILSNLTREEEGAVKVLKTARTMEKGLETLVDVFCKVKFNEHGADLDHIAYILANVAQTKEGREMMLCHSKPLIGRLLPFLKADLSSVVRRRGIAMTLKNCCFDYEHHEWLLGAEIEILPHLLLPLAGNEEFTEEENEDLLIDLQYLPDDKMREEDAEIRRTLLESLMLLCADKYGRKFVKDAGTYYIIRELHLWEMDHGPEENSDQCEKLVQMLISDEPEVGKQNLFEVKEEEKT